MPYPSAVWDQSFQRGNQTGFPLWPPDIQRYRQVASTATKFLQRIAGSLTSTNEKWAVPFRAGSQPATLERLGPILRHSTVPLSFSSPSVRPVPWPPGLTQGQRPDPPENAANTRRVRWPSANR